MNSYSNADGQDPPIAENGGTVTYFGEKRENHRNSAFNNDTQLDGSEPRAEKGAVTRGGETSKGGGRTSSVRKFSLLWSSVRRSPKCSEKSGGHDQSMQG